MMIQSLEVRIQRFIKRHFPDQNTQQVICALRDILQLSDQGRAYRREILSCYSLTRQAEIQPEFHVAVENVLAQYINRSQLCLFEEVGA